MTTYICKKFRAKSLKITSLNPQLKKNTI